MCCSFRCTLCKGSAGVPGDRHSRTTCIKLLVHGVSSIMKLQDLENLGERSVFAMKQAVNFIATNLVPAVPADWVHVVIVDVFAAPVGAFHSTSAVFSIVGLDNIGDKIQCEETFVLFHVLLSKFKKCMNSAQAKQVMFLSHNAQLASHLQHLYSRKMHPTWTLVECLKFREHV